MSIKLLSRCCFSLLIVAFVSGCATSGVGQPAFLNKCKWSPSSCMYEGSYEPGEREYAEQEAQRLNRAAYEKLRRSAGG